MTMIYDKIGNKNNQLDSVNKQFRFLINKNLLRLPKLLPNI